MTPQTMAEAIQQIDDLTDQLKFARKTLTDLMQLADSLRAERDTWRAQASL